MTLPPFLPPLYMFCVALPWFKCLFSSWSHWPSTMIQYYSGTVNKTYAATKAREKAGCLIRDSESSAEELVQDPAMSSFITGCSKLPAGPEHKHSATLSLISSPSPPSISNNKSKMKRATTANTISLICQWLLHTYSGRKQGCKEPPRASRHKPWV